MRRSHASAVLGVTLVAVLLGCGDASQESPDPGAASAADAPAADAGTPAPAAATGAAFLDPNEATREELLAVPGMDDALADAVIAGRPYGDMVAVDRVLSGSLDEAQRDAVYARLWKPLDLNQASGEEILLIPGVGNRMQHEFEEYRPYRSIEQFRREIGKYVNEAEVARLEQYVTLP